MDTRAEIIEEMKHEAAYLARAQARKEMNQ